MPWKWTEERKIPRVHCVHVISIGPEIYDFFVEDGKAYVVCSPVEIIRFRHFRVPYNVVRGQDIQAAQIDVIPGTNYIRAEVIDKDGRKA